MTTINYDQSLTFSTDAATIKFCNDLHSLPESFGATITQARARRLVAKYYATHLVGLKTAQINALYKILGYDETVAAEVYAALKDRVTNPAGSFDKSGRFYADQAHLVSCRSPSRAYPYSQMQACRTLKYVKAAIMDAGSSDKVKV